MTHPVDHPLHNAQAEALEARFALRVGARLSEGAAQLPHDITERLRVARQQALAQARGQVLARPAHEAASATGVGLTIDVQGTATASGWGGHPLASPTWRKLDDGPVSWRWRLASLAPLVALVAGLWAIHAYHKHERIRATAEVDMALLTDDLPPAAYADPGFEEFLRTGASDPAPPTDMPLWVEDLIAEALSNTAGESQP
ncbi:DUF3619 family protein [Aquabacterium fontiphilum]|uniref:DUF3619 family protein n=1 Tax=Aquabacterium fontiphilum TaxID=450365 RepID=UPI002ED09602